MYYYTDFCATRSVLSTYLPQAVLAEKQVA
jgi:hypothetical protein